MSGRLSAIVFGNCEVNLAHREVRLDGQVQPLPQKAFDVLVCLLDKRSEVVSRSELSRLVWGARPLPEATLAKAMMRVRRAIGDDGEQPVWIKTIHQVGYRFVGEAFSLDARPPTGTTTGLPLALPATPSAPGATLRLALLPIENRTGESQLVWIELGLATLVIQALKGDPQLAPLPLLSVLQALDSMAPTATPPERAAALHRALGAQCVVHTVLERREGKLQLHYRSHGPGGRQLEGTLNGDEAVQLGEALAQDLTNGLCPSRSRTVRFESEDPFFNQLLARAGMLRSERQFQEVITVLKAALIFEPANLGARLLLLESLVKCGDRACVALGDDLLSGAREQGDARLQGMVHGAMSLMWPSGFDLARQGHLRQALHFAEQHPHDDWVIDVRISAAVDAAMHNDIVSSMEHFVWLREAHLNSRNLFSWVTMTLNFATLHVQICDLQRAQELLEEALVVAETEGWKWLQTALLAQLAALHAALGGMSKSVELLERSQTLDAPLQDESHMSLLLHSATMVCSVINATERLAPLMDRCARLQSSGKPLSAAFFRMAQGEMAAANGCVDSARDMMREAIAVAVETRYALIIHAWMTRLLLLELRSGHADNARAVCGEIRALAGFEANPDLRAWLLYAEAAERHAEGEGETDAALQLLLLAVHCSTAGLPNAHARLAAAWLQLERNRAADAAALVEPISHWLDEHPVGLTVAARLQFANGNLAQAAIRQRRANAMWEGSAEAACRLALLACYELADEGDAHATAATRTRISALPTLVTLL